MQHLKNENAPPTVPSDLGTPEQWKLIEGWITQPEYAPPPKRNGETDLEFASLIYATAHENWDEAEWACDREQIAKFKAEFEIAEKVMLKAYEATPSVQPEERYMPEGFMFDQLGQLCCMVADKKGVESARVITNKSIWLDEMVRGEDGASYLKLKFFNSRSKIESYSRVEVVLMPADNISRPSDVSACLLKNYFSEFNPHYLPHLARYLQDSMSQFKKRTDAGIAYTKFGFDSRGGFILGNQRITKDGTTEIAPKISPDMVKGFSRPGGTLNG